MKKLIIYSILFISTFFSSCSDNETTTTSLEGTWLLQNISTGAKLTFQGQNWTLNSGTVTITGTFTLANNKMSGKAVTRTGASSNLLQPDTFTGNIAILNNKVTFTNFSGNWIYPFSSWYQKK
jgi:hypothetical protein